MDQLLARIRELRRAREDENHSSNSFWNQVLAIFQLINCLVFVLMIPSFMETYIVQESCMKNQYRIMILETKTCGMEKWWTVPEMTQTLKMNHVEFNKHIQQAIEDYFKRLKNWLMFKTSSAVLHLISAMLLILGTMQNISRLHRIMFCGFAKYLNMCFMAYEYVNLMLRIRGKTEQEYYILCLVYRLFFHFKVDELLDTLLNTSAPPPGYK